MIKKTLLLALLSTLCLGLQPARANHVDFMNDGVFTQMGAVTNRDIAGDPGNILGGIRDLSLTGGAASLSALGPLIFDAGATPTTLTLGYGAPFSGGAFTADFVNAGTNNWNSLVVTLVDASNGANGTLSLTVDSGGNQFTFASQNVTTGGSYTFFYSAAPGINFQSINGVQLNLSSTVPSSSFSIGGITRVNSIPEPGTTALALAGGLGLLVLLRRRRTV